MQVYRRFILDLHSLGVHFIFVVVLTLVNGDGKRVVLVDGLVHNCANRTVRTYLYAAEYAVRIIYAVFFKGFGISEVNLIFAARLCNRLGIVIGNVFIVC